LGQGPLNLPVYARYTRRRRAPRRTPSRQSNKFPIFLIESNHKQAQLLFGASTPRQQLAFTKCCKGDSTQCRIVGTKYNYAVQCPAPVT
jgi:hypothetical protein